MLSRGNNLHCGLSLSSLSLNKLETNSICVINLIVTCLVCSWCCSLAPGWSGNKVAKAMLEQETNRETFTNYLQKRQYCRHLGWCRSLGCHLNSFPKAKDQSPNNPPTDRLPTYFTYTQIWARKEEHSICHIINSLSTQRSSIWPWVNKVESHMSHLSLATTGILIKTNFQGPGHVRDPLCNNRMISKMCPLN